MVLSVHGSRELRATALAMRLVARDVRNDINRGTRQVMNPIWRDGVARKAQTAMDRAVIAKGARIAAGNPPAAIAASSTRALSGGLVPAVSWSGFEFGANQSKVLTYQGRSPRGKAYTMRRHTTHQLPARNRSGRVAYAALADLGPRLASLWVQTVVRKIHDAAEKGQR